MTYLSNMDLPISISNQEDVLSLYKFKSLQTYSDTEWLADNKKRYRQVYDESELNYIYAELCFINKGFDREEWSAVIELRCFKSTNKSKPICHLTFQRDISKEDAVIYVREGWGNKKEGSFWKTGAYYWEASIDGEKVGTRFFYVQSAGKKPVDLPDDYLMLGGVKLYEGPMDDVPEHERVYLSQFDYKNTRFVYAELTFANEVAELSWHLELVVKFFSESRELKGKVVKFLTVNEEEATVKVTVGWGSDTIGTWREGLYHAELVFLDRLLGTVYIDMGEDQVMGNPLVWLPGQERAQPLVDLQPDSLALQEVLDELDTLIGLDSVKNQIRERTAYMEFIRLRQRKGFKEEGQIQLHALFKGNPGTGKTTVAQMMGAIYFQLGLLSKGHVHTVDRVDLVGEFIGQTAPKVRDAVEKARGGVLFIDEAYALARSNDDVKDFGREVIEILVKEMSDGPGDLAVIAAGYPAEMDFFIQSNPGLKSRIKMEITFPDYVPAELALIADKAAQKMEIHLDEDAKRITEQIIVREYRSRDKSFGNARFVFDLIEKAKIQLGLRIMSTDDPEVQTNEALETIIPEDILKATLINLKNQIALPVDEELLTEALLELDELHGLERIKKDIRETVLLVRYFLTKGYKPLQRFSMHTLFVGNPGTGKTTVARILAKVYKALGLLEKGQVIETDRQGLVAGFVGQTAIKTAERIKEAQGGVLFIDEAYALSQPGAGSAGDFGDEAIQTLLKRMEDQRGNFFVFAAGYPDNMEKFLKANPGLRSRFDKTLIFDDYSIEELEQIAIWQLQEKEFIFSPEARMTFFEWISKLHHERDRYFGNARIIRQITESMVNAQQTANARSHADGQSFGDQIISVETVKTVKEEAKSGNWDKKGIGFRK